MINGLVNDKLEPRIRVSFTDALEIETVIDTDYVGTNAGQPYIQFTSSHSTPYPVTTVAVASCR
jgi:hypothetical protein